jgi:hypothetical protein
LNNQVTVFLLLPGRHTTLLDLDRVDARVDMEPGFATIRIEARRRLDVPRATTVIERFILRSRRTGQGVLPSQTRKPPARQTCNRRQYRLLTRIKRRTSRIDLADYPWR